MAILLTNGKYFIAHNKTGGVIKVSDMSQAQDFITVDNAIEQAFETPGKCTGYYYIDTSITPIQPSSPIIKVVKIKSKNVTNKSAVKRKRYSEEQRREIYKKSGGCCQLCGRKISFTEMTVDHIMPISKGGSNDMDNTEATCRICNQFKSNIFPDQFIDRITEIFMFQMEKRYGGKDDWKAVHNLLMEML